MELRQRQSAGQMSLLVFSRPVHPELFDIYRRDQVVQDRYEARIWVTGLSHCVSFHREKASVVEVVGPSTAPLPQRGRLLEVSLRGEKDHEAVGGDLIRYRGSFQVESLSARVFARTHQELTEQAARGGILVTFPGGADAKDLAPFTYIDYDATVDHLGVFAYHAFPDELTVLKTQSLFELV